MNPLAQELILQVLRDYQSPQGQVVRMFTGRESAGESLARSRTYLHEHLPKASMELIDAHLEANRKSHPVAEVYGPVPGVALVSEDVLRKVFRRVDGEPDGWVRFNTTYPQSCGIMEWSCPAFSSDGSEAMICVGVQEHWMAGHGTYWHYERKAEVWQKLQGTMAWIS